MHVRIRCYGEPDRIVAVQSQLKKIEQLKLTIEEKYNIAQESQRLFYGGKLLENDYTFYDYNIKRNDVIQLVVNTQFAPSTLQEEEIKVMSKEENTEEDLNSYLDAESTLYEKEDLVDVKHNKQGKWQEGKIIRIVHDPMDSKEDNDKTNQGEQDVENHQSNLKIGEDKNNELTKGDKLKTGKLLYKIQLDNDEHESEYYKESDIRPRARTALSINEIEIGQMVMVNYNIELPNEKGDWYDFKVEKIRTVKKNTEIVGTLYFGENLVPQHNTKIREHDKIFSIEEPVHVAQRTEEYNAMMKTQPEQRSKPILCNFCHDDESVSCRECGCIVCSGKHEPAKIILCDECNSGYHIYCLQQPEKKLPDGDWYCPNCVRDTTAIVAPGAAAQPRKKLNTSRDWGRGMACAGKTRTCAMPSNHFGPIPGIEVGMCWRFRIQLSECGVHRPPVSGIHGRDVQGAFSIVLSGGYEDDVDNGDEFTYTGSGGRDLSGNKRTAGQSSDQTLTRENRALARNCAAGEISEAGGDAGDSWRLGKPVRVVRSYKMLRHFPKYAPSEGIRYDGIYKVVKYYPENGLSGYKVWKYLLRRDDPSPAPWERGAKKYPVIYPDGYLEAEAEKRALMEKKAKTTKGGKKTTVKNNNLSNYMSEEVATNSNVSNNPKEATSSRKSEIKDEISSLNKKQTDNNEEPSTSKKSTRTGNKTASNDGSLPSNPMAEVVPSDETFTSAKDKKLTSAGKKYVLRSRNLRSNSMSEKVASNQSVSENPEEPTTSKIFKKRSKKSPLSSSDLSSNEMSPKEAVIEKNNKPLIFTMFTRAGKKTALNQSNLSSNSMSDVSFNQFASENLEEPTTSTRSLRTCKKRSLCDKNIFSDSFSDDEQQHPSKKKKFTNEPLELSNRHIDRNTWIRYNTGPQESNNRLNNNQRNALKSNKENCDIGKKASSFLSLEERNTIAVDYRNSKLWAECLDTRINAKKEFLDLVVQTFICIICQDTVVNPVTTECLHNYCLGCLRMAFRVGTEDGATPTCPHCRHELFMTPSVADINVSLRNALRTIIPGYDSRNK